MLYRGVGRVPECRWLKGVNCPLKKEPSMARCRTCLLAIIAATQLPHVYPKKGGMWPYGEST